MATILQILQMSKEDRIKAYRAEGIEEVIINGHHFTDYGVFSFLYEKSYIKEPVRSGNGVIGNLNSYATFLTPHLKIDFSLMSIDTYRELMLLIYERNEFEVTCYDVVYNKIKTHKMYFTTEERPKLWTIVEELNGKNTVGLIGVRDYTVEMVGTNADVELKSIIYYYNETNDKTDKTKFEAEEDVYVGEDIVIGASSTYPDNPPQNKKFSHWEGSDGYIYDNGAITRINDNLELYAMWESDETDTLSFNYGLSSVTGETDRQVQEDKSIGDLPIPEAQVSVTYKEKTYYPYHNPNWYRLPIRSREVLVENGTPYWTNRDSIIYCLYETKKYTVKFEALFTEYLDLPNITAEYGAQVPLPILKGSDLYSFVGWYLNDGTEFDGKMPPKDITLYAKWEEIK